MAGMDRIGAPHRRWCNVFVVPHNQDPQIMRTVTGAATVSVAPKEINYYFL